MRQTTTKIAMAEIMFHRAHTQAILASDTLTNSEKILVLTQLNAHCEMILNAEGCYYGYTMPDLTDSMQQAINFGLSKIYLSQPEYYMHHYQARVKQATNKVNQNG